MSKRIICIILSFIMAVATVNPIGVMASETSTYAWPGRPGGNGDGSEEWLQGEYGETNGPYELISTSYGLVSELGINSKLEAIAQFMIDKGAQKIHPDFGEVVTVVGLLAALLAPDYEGTYYKMCSYVSGRSMKIVTTTYTNSNYTGYVATYVEYIEW